MSSIVTLRTEFKLLKGDSKDFIEKSAEIVSSIAWQFRVKEVCLIRIKNWFDHKWLNYSGKSVVPFASGGVFERDAALQDEWRVQLSVPPFHPSKVVSEKFYRLKPSNNKMFEKKLHTIRSSNDNIHNRISNYTDDGLFAWYSSNSGINKKGSLMVYRLQKDDIETFYASFEDADGWKIVRSKGIDLRELKMHAGEKK